MFNVCSLQEEWRFLLSGGTSIPKELINPAPKWLSERAWKEILSLAALVSKTFSFMKINKYMQDFSVQDLYIKNNISSSLWSCFWYWFCGFWDKQVFGAIC